VSGSPPGGGVVVVIVSYSVTRTTPGIGSSTTSTTVSSTTGLAGAFLGVFLIARFVVFFADFLTDRFFGAARFAAFLRPGLALAFPRFAAFLRAATRFFALAMAISREMFRRQANLAASQPSMSLSFGNSPRYS
jgi:hypothetical protein